MRHAKTRTGKTPAVLAGLTLTAMIGLCIGGLLSDSPDAPQTREYSSAGPETPGASDDAPKTPAEGQKRKDQAAAGPSGIPTSAVSQSPASTTQEKNVPSKAAEKRGEKSSAKPDTKNDETPEVVETGTPKPGPPTPESHPTTEEPTQGRIYEPEPKVYEFFIADDTEQNRTWCEKHESGSTKVQIGRMYKSHYDDKDPAKAFASWPVSYEKETCP